MYIDAVAVADNGKAVVVATLRQNGDADEVAEEGDIEHDGHRCDKGQVAYAANQNK